MSNHTPGPWSHDDRHVFIDDRHLVCCGRGHGECCGNPDVEGDITLIATVEESDDARMIAAAPRLHAALHGLLSQMEECQRQGLVPTIYYPAFTEAAKAYAEAIGLEYEPPSSGVTADEP